MPADINKLLTLVDRKQPLVRQLAYLVDGIVEANCGKVLALVSTSVNVDSEEWVLADDSRIAKACNISRRCPTVIDSYKGMGGDKDAVQIPKCLAKEIQQAYSKLLALEDEEEGVSNYVTAYRRNRTK